MTVFIENFSIAGYRSFGAIPQRLEKLNKITLLIGRNNSGKSNIIRFLSEIYPLFEKGNTIHLSYLNSHIPSRPPVSLGRVIKIESTSTGDTIIPLSSPMLAKIQPEHIKYNCAHILGSILNAKREEDKTNEPWILISHPADKNEENTWRQAFRKIDDSSLHQVWSNIFQRRGGSREAHWEPEILLALQPPVNPLSVVVIPAIRQIGKPGSDNPSHDGTGIISRLAQLQNPTVDHQEDRLRFLAIRDFLRDVIDSIDAEIEIPHDRQTIVVHMNGKALPIDSLGTGIHEVIILAAAATVNTSCVMCIEEPELHLNPLLQRKLLRYLSVNTSNQYLISTHSAAIMDTPGAEAYHVRLENDCSVIERITSDSSKSTVCHDLGYHPSDLMQANCLIWVEGPSDRIYIKYWISSIAPDLIEGIHYSIMFYGGKLASHLSFENDELAAEELISLRRLNRRSAIVIDSDQANSAEPINATKLRLQSEFNKGPGHAWITEGREIENYLPPTQIISAIKKLNPGATTLTSMSRYQNCLRIKTHSGKTTQASKVRVAHEIVSSNAADLSVLNLKAEVSKLTTFIRDSNPTKAK